jgi:MtN3 and saliva related transmembrane protein
MIEMDIQVIGYIAAFFTTASFVPQVYMTYQTKSTKDISLWMYAMFCAGVLAWFVYGIMIVSYPIIIANIVTAILATYVLYIKTKNVYIGKEKM